MKTSTTKGIGSFETRIAQIGAVLLAIGFAIQIALIDGLISFTLLITSIPLRSCNLHLNLLAS
jgi:hypothetical protein